MASDYWNGQDRQETTVQAKSAVLRGLVLACTAACAAWLHASSCPTCSFVASSNLSLRFFHWLLAAVHWYFLPKMPSAWFSKAPCGWFFLLPSALYSLPFRWELPSFLWRTVSCLPLLTIHLVWVQLTPFGDSRNTPCAGHIKAVRVRREHKCIVPVRRASQPPYMEKLTFLT